MAARVAIVIASGRRSLSFSNVISGQTGVGNIDGIEPNLLSIVSTGRLNIVTTILEIATTIIGPGILGVYFFDLIIISIDAKATITATKFVSCICAK